MQISDLVGQYNNATARPEMTGTKGIQKLVSTLRDMKSGNIFEGTVNSVKGQKVTLALPNGQEVTARMDGKVKLTIGQSMFFQVKANDGSQIAIRPYTVEGNSMNLTLMEALKAANIAVDGRNLSMVNAMMEEQLSIDRNSLNQMARIIQNHPDVDVKTLVQMQKLDIPITPEMTSQFQNYLEDKQAIGKALSDFIEVLPTAISNEEMSAEQLIQTANDVLSIVTEGLPENIEIPQAVLQEGMKAFGMPGEEIIQQTEQEFVDGNATAASEDLEAAVGHNANETSQNMVENSSGRLTYEGVELHLSSVQSGEEQNASSAVQLQEQISKMLPEGLNLEGQIEVGHTLGSILKEEELQNLAKQLEQLPELSKNETLFFDGKLMPLGSSVALLNAIKTQLVSFGMERDGIMSLLSGKEFQALIRDAMEQQWTIKPQELPEKDKIGKLYEKIEHQLDRLESVVKATGQTSEQVSQLAADIRNNVQFMDQINQNYTYVQIPLKMAGQNASGELYVYTNKKSLAEGTQDLTAFLHLDMEHLGSTDVSVKLHGKNVSTNFYFDNDESYALVQSYASVLEARLQAKGYNCTVNVKNEQKQVNFVEDFLKKDQPSAGLVHRYSFDMRA